MIDLDDLLKDANANDDLLELIDFLKSESEKEESLVYDDIPEEDQVLFNESMIKIFDTI